MSLTSPNPAAAHTRDTPTALERIPTPFLLINGRTVRRNLSRLASYTREHRLNLRPHTKTHKSTKLARMQIEAGAAGLTIAKVGEAEVMAEVHDDLLLAYPVVDEHRAKRVAKLAGRCDLKVAIDSALAADVLNAAAQQAGVRVGILVDLDVGLARTGLQSPHQALTLAKQVHHAPALTLRGLFCYPGHIWAPLDQQARPLAAVNAKLEEAVNLYHHAGLNIGIVSGGSTPTAYQSHLAQHITEIRPGTYIFNDMNTAHGGYCQLDDCAARIVCTVVSDAVPRQVVIDAGNKTLTMDPCRPAPDSGHSHILEYPQAKITRLSEEHGQVDVARCDHRPRLGERLTVIPNHICPCVNLQDQMWWCDTPTGPAQPMPVTARGMLT